MKLYKKFDLIPAKLFFEVFSEQEKLILDKSIKVEISSVIFNNEKCYNVKYYTYDK